MCIFYRLGVLERKNRKMGQEKKVGEEKKNSKKGGEETFVGIFFFLVFQSCFMFGVCMIEAISCTQTEFFVG